MNIKNILRSWLLDERPSPEVHGTLRCTSDYNLHDQGSTNVIIFPAIGGQVIEFRRYDHQKDKSYVSRYIIKDDDDFGNRMSNIITLENLKN